MKLLNSILFKACAHMHAGMCARAHTHTHSYSTSQSTYVNQLTFVAVYPAHRPSQHICMIVQWC